MKATTIYMAYGSNMNREQMANRCPGAKVLGTAYLDGFELLFRGVATVERKGGSSVPVLLWAITSKDEMALDHYEGWPRLYRKEYHTVVFEGRSVEAMIYIMNDHYPYDLPSRIYLRTIAEGYDAADFDEAILLQAVRRSMEKRNTKG